MISAALLFSRVTGALKAIPWQVWAGLAIIAAAWFYGNHREAQGYAEAVAVYQPRIDAEKASHKATKATYRNAQAEAKRLQDEAIAAEIARQEKINAAVREDYNRRLADVRSRANSLRAEAGASAGSSAGEVRMPAEAEAASGIDDPADCNAVFAGYVAGQLPSLEARIMCGEAAEKQALDHAALLEWVEQQAED